MGSHSLVAPPLVVDEIANTCWKKVRRHPGLRDQLLAAHARLPKLRLRLQDVAMPEVLQLADQTGLTVYDAAYAWLSRSLRAELVSLDARSSAPWLTISTRRSRPCAGPLGLRSRSLSRLPGEVAP